tara:strand:- start:404 stop:547 length:144 start_codon:yes stop_codon:yes gene_type:complete
MIIKDKLFLFDKIINNYHNKQRLCLERAKQHDYFAQYIVLTNKGTKQ